MVISSFLWFSELKTCWEKLQIQITRKVTSLTPRNIIPVVSGLFLTTFLKIFFENKKQLTEIEKLTFFRTKNTNYGQNMCFSKKYTFLAKICQIFKTKYVSFHKKKFRFVGHSFWATEIFVKKVGKWWFWDLSWYL